jgi:hypothetical protein
MTTAQQKPKRPPPINTPGALGIYDGQDRAGTVVRQGDEFFAFDAGGKCVGVFDTMLEASRKIPRCQEATR